jgi:hypothetical protein
MFDFASPRFLRNVLWTDAASCVGSAALQLAAPAALARMLGLPAQLILASGVFLVGVALYIGFLASRAQPPRPGVWLLIAGNWAWVAGCVVLAFGSGVTALGVAYLVLQAVAVTVLAELEWLGLRRTSAAAWA